MSVPDVPAGAVLPAADSPWYRTITSAQWKALGAAALGWMLDAMDFQIYPLVLGSIMTEFNFDKPTAGVLTTVTLLTSAVGGMLFGVIADRIGRTRALMGTILIYSFCSLMTATATDFTQLVIWRALLGFGMGGEWACAAVLVSETWPAQHRGKAISIMQSGWAVGSLVAAFLAALVLETFGLNWRWLFVVGVLPALLVVWIRREVHEPELWSRAERVTVDNPVATILRPPLLRVTLVAVLLSSAVMFAYWGLISWIPQFLQDTGSGAGLTRWQTFGQLVPLQVGAFFGYLSFGFLAEKFGRRRTVIAFLAAAAGAVLAYAQLAHEPLLLLAVAPLLGFAGHGYFSVFGSMLAELFPTRVRGTGQGFTYNAGRAFAALAPYTVGLLAEPPNGLGTALAFTAVFFGLAAVVMLFMPDRSGQQLEA